MQRAALRWHSRMQRGWRILLDSLTQQDRGSEWQL